MPWVYHSHLGDIFNDWGPSQLTWTHLRLIWNTSATWVTTSTVLGRLQPIRVKPTALFTQLWAQLRPTKTTSGPLQLSQIHISYYSVSLKSISAAALQLQGRSGHLETTLATSSANLSSWNHSSHLELISAAWNPPRKNLWHVDTYCLSLLFQYGAQ
jgi:hypothetical protein